MQADRCTLLLQDGRRLHIFCTPAIRFGRGSEPDVPLVCVFPGNQKATTLANRTLSRKHLEIYREGGRVRYVDGWRENASPSTHGISIDGMRVNYGELQQGRTNIIAIGSGARAPHIPHWQLYFPDAPPAADGRRGAPAALYMRRLDVIRDDILWIWGPVDLRSINASGRELWVDVIAGRLVLKHKPDGAPQPPEGEIVPGVCVQAFGALDATTLTDALLAV